MLSANDITSVRALSAYGGFEDASISPTAIVHLFRMWGQYLTHQGVTDFYFVLSHLPEKLETLLGDGQRWDSTFRYHLIRDPDHPYQNLKHILLPDTPILLAHCDRLPECHILSDQNDFVLFCHTPKPNGTKNMDRLGPVNTL